MKTLTVRVPMRADLAGGTLDLWPLYLFHPGACTVNVAISYFAECEVSYTGEGGIELFLTDLAYRKRYETLKELAGDPKATLLAKILEHFNVSGIRLTTRTDAPRGSGLGGSSALAIAVVRAVSELVGKPVEGAELIALVRDLETRLLGLPAGIQDYYPPVYGGLASLHLLPGTPVRVPIRLSTQELAPHFVLHYSDVQHFSGTNNWEIYKRHIDGDAGVREGLSRIAATAVKMERALEEHRLEDAGTLLAEEWTNRKALIDGITTREIDKAVSAAANAGAWGGKACGAGGGGCIVFLCPAEKRDAVIKALASAPGRTLRALPIAQGLSLEEQGQRQVAFSFVDLRSHTRGDPLEQLYLTGEKRGAYEPHLLVEGVITYDDPRAGIYLTQTRSLLVPLDHDADAIDWRRAAKVDPDSLKLAAVPDPGREFAIAPDSGQLVQVMHDGQESFCQFLEEQEKLTIFENSAFELFSEPHESREAFLARCSEAAKQRLDEETHRLEGTFRRRLDQMKQRLEKEDRDIETDDDPRKQNAQDMNIAWGQTLYDITRGKRRPKEMPRTAREGDYMGRIAELQRQWDRELETKRDDLNQKARQIEEILLTVQRKNIEVQRYVLLWVAGTSDPEKPTKARRASSRSHRRSPVSVSEEKPK